MLNNVRASEAIALLGTLDPQTVANVEKFTDVVDMSAVGQALFIFKTGDMAAETIDAKVYACDSDGSNAVALKSATQLTAHATNNDNVQILIGIRAEDLHASGKRYVKGGLVTGGTTGGPCSCTVLGVDARFEPASGSNLASVKQVVN